ncbi:hypothetical protein DPMN_179704 [Dreissena polymorpha]|uniref:C-type lectin domain-containing protein n=2 Tax=Dreissena polymorpha TaxID=45954 RepID=A0A9D4IME9_DREPO|nr:hypothetical protein DPMN_179704 [Dreissena polymorpha]
MLDRTKILMQNNNFWLGAKKEIGDVWRWLSGVTMSPLPLENDNDREYSIKCVLVYQGAPDDATCAAEVMHVCEITF